MSDSSSILVGRSGDQALVKVVDKGSYQNAPGLKEFTRKMMTRGCRNFTIDLGGCPGMDSTFMGTLAGIALRLKDMGGGSLQVVNITERNFDSLRNLGLDALFDMSQEEMPEQATTPLPSNAGKTETAEVMLEAHEALVEADPENQVRFKDVLEYLQSDLAEDSAS